jgi:hypothetical protein
MQYVILLFRELEPALTTFRESTFLFRLSETNGWLPREAKPCKILPEHAMQLKCIITKSLNFKNILKKPTVRCVPKM